MPKYIRMRLFGEGVFFMGKIFFGKNILRTAQFDWSVILFCVFCRKSDKRSCDLVCEAFL